MKIFRAVICGCTLAAGTTLAATPIDTEQKAAAATQQGINFIRSAPGRLQFLSDEARGHVDAALDQLGAATTPAALLRAPAGITLPCDGGGSLEARMPHTFPRVLRLRWNQCASSQPGVFRHVRDGDAEVTMLIAGFAPKNIAGLRLGSAARDFTNEVVFVDPDQTSQQVWTFNLRMTGLIPMTRSLGNFGVFTGPFAYELTGFFDAAFRVEFPEGGPPAFDSHLRILAEHVIAAGSLEYTSPAMDHYVSETNLLWGTTTTTFFQPPPLGALQTVSSYEGLRLRDETDFASFTSSIAIDGKLNFRPTPAPIGLPDGCVGGDLVYRTRVPLSGPAFGEITSGELVLNHSATARFYSAANVPPTLPLPTQGLLLRFEIRGAGSFDHDTASVFETLRQVGQCFSP